MGDTTPDGFYTPPEHPLNSLSVPTGSKTVSTSNSVASAISAKSSMTSLPSMNGKTQSGPLKTPFESPDPTAKKPNPQPELTPDQSTKYASVLSTVSTWTQIPTSSARNASTEPITDDERMWLTRECLLRYLRATKWSVPDAQKRLLATLTWRREYGVYRHTAEYISPENETGKQVILGYDNNARPCLYLNPAKQNTKKSDRQLEHLVYMLERVVDMMGPGQETTALLINFKDSSSASSPSVSQGRQTLTILQGHYPERLGRALISELPWYITTFFKLISPFIDPVTKDKMKFNESLRKWVPPSQLWKAYGGDVEFEYDHSVYWPSLNKMCEERRKEYKERWVRAGKKIGEYEAYLRGGDQLPLQGHSEKVAKTDALLKENELPNIQALKVAE